MTPERWAVIEALFSRAVDAAPDERAALLADAEPDVGSEVSALLAAIDDGERALREAIATAAGELARDTPIGQRIGPYRLRDMLGEGGMGRVYLATRDDAEFSREVAIKILRGGLVSAEAIARFRHERQILARLEHPAIVRLLDGGRTDDGLPYLVMEVVRGSSITRHARDRALAVRDRVRLLVPICEAVAYAHRQLVVHRDLKPSNILIDASGAPKLLDFGIAKLLDAEPHTIAGATPLTVAYASPEQVRGDPVTTTSDVYSLGAVLFELVTGKPPYVGDSDAPLASTLAANRREVAGDLDNIIARALRRDPAERYSSAEHLAEDLRHYLAGEPVSARRPTLAYRIGKWWMRHRLAATTVAAVATVGIAFGVVAVVRVARARRELASTVNRLYVEQGRELSLANDPRRALAYFAAAIEDGNDTPALRFSIAHALRELDQERVVLHLDEPVRVVAWRPDGQVLASGGDRGELRLWAGETDMARLTGHAAAIVGIAWNRDGRVLATSDIAGHVVVRDGDGRPRFAFDGTVADDTVPIFIAADRLAVLGDRDVVVWDTTTGQRVDRRRSRDGVWAAGGGRIAVATAFGIDTPGCTLDLFEGAPTRIAVADSGTWLAAASGATVAIVNLASCAVVSRFDEADPITQLVFGPVNGQLATLTLRSQLRVWSMTTSHVVAALDGHIGRIASIAVSPLGNELVSAGTDARVDVWLPTGGLEREIALHAAAVTSVAVSPDGAWLATGSTDRTVRIVVANPVLTVGAEDRDLAAFDIGRDVMAGYGAMPEPYPNHVVDARLVGSDVVTLGDRGTVTRWHAGVATHVAVACPAHAQCTLTADGTGLAIAVGNRAWTVDWTGRAYPEVRHTSTIRLIRASTPAWIATASDDGELALWSPTGTVQAIVHGPREPLAIAWSADGRIAATRDATGTSVWDANGSLIRRIEARPGGQRELALDAQGDRLIAAGPDGELAVWAVATGPALAALEPHHGDVSSVALSPDGTLVASVGIDGVRIDDAWTGAVLAYLDRGIGHDPASRLAFDAGGTHLMLGGEELFARVWDVARDDRAADVLAAVLPCRCGYRLTGSVLQPFTCP